MSGEKVVIAGAGGYVGRHLVASLVKQGYDVAAVSRSNFKVPGVKWYCGDLLDSEFCKIACEGATQVYNLAATVGGIGFIAGKEAQCMSSAAININLLLSLAPSTRYFFASSSCVYPSSPTPLSEHMVQPERLSGYGLEKFYSEKTAQAFARDFGIQVRIARLHTVYGPGDFRGEGRDHFPTALTGKVVEAVRSKVHEIKIWGDGTQSRSLLYIDDAVEGIQRIMNSSCESPLNLASSEVVTVNGVVTTLEDITAVKLNRFYFPGSPVGVQHKTSNNANLREAISWEPMTPTRVGLGRLYRSAFDRALKS